MTIVINIGEMMAIFALLQWAWEVNGKPTFRQRVPKKPPNPYSI